MKSQLIINNFLSIKGLALLVLFMMLNIQESHAKHIVGGDMTYVCTDFNAELKRATFLITFSIYRDAAGDGAEFDNPAEFGIYVGSGTSWRIIESQGILRRRISRSSKINPDPGVPCLQIPSNIDVERAVYEFEVILDVLEDESYLIAYQRCCRNVTVNNILNPGDEGALYSVEITPDAQKMCDNSPTFNELAPLVICVNEQLNFNHSATDMDGDSIVYSFCSPIVAGGTRGSTAATQAFQDACDGIKPNPANCPPRFTPVSWRSGYSPTSPIGGSPVVSIDPMTGVISGTPTLLGQFVVAVCAKSYRNGKLINEIRRDFQFNVTQCEPLVNAGIAYDELVGDKKFKIRSCGVTDVDIINRSELASAIETYEWLFPLTSGDTLKYSTRDVTVSLPDTGDYTGFLYINRGSQFKKCRDTAEIFIKVFPEVKADFNIDLENCEDRPVVFEDDSKVYSNTPYSTDWSFNNAFINGEKNWSYQLDSAGDYTVRLRVEDANKCVDVKDTLIRYFPIPNDIQLSPEKYVACSPEYIKFKDLSDLLDDRYKVVYDIEGVGVYEGLSPTVYFENAGLYNVDITIESLTGCKYKGVYGDFIKILPGPTAGFNYTPEDVSILNNVVQFEDVSEGAISWTYIIDSLALFERNPLVTFQDTGIVKVQQVVINNENCPDTAFVDIDVKPVTTYYMPNAFTPNEDNINDEFLGKGYTDGFKSFSMQIYNRWGDMVFETDDPKSGWNGSRENSDEKCPSGTYVYKVYYVGPRNEEETLRGHLNLIR